MCPTLCMVLHTHGLLAKTRGRAQNDSEGRARAAHRRTFEEMLQLAGSLEKDTYYRTACDFANLIPPFKNP